MNNESIRNLHLDRRLHGRRNWINDEELQTALDALPDVASKLKTPEDDEPEAAIVEQSAPVEESPEPGLPHSPEGGGV